MIVVGGGIGAEGEHLLAGVREVVYARSTPLATQRLSIVQTQSGPLSGALGAARLVIEEQLSVMSVNSWFENPDNLDRHS